MIANRVFPGPEKVSSPPNHLLAAVNCAPQDTYESSRRSVHSDSHTLHSRWTFACSRGRDGLRELLPEWQKLAESIPALGFVQTPEWAEAYADHLAPDPERLLWVTAREHDRLVAVLPLERSAASGWEWRMLTHDHMTLADVTVHPDATSGLWLALWRWLQDAGLDWVSLDIPQVNSDAMVDGWMGAAPPRMTTSNATEGTACLSCDRNYEKLLKAASANHRSSLLRGLRRAEQTGTLRYETHCDPKSLEDAMPHFLEVEASGWKGKQGGAVACKAELIAFYHQLALRMGAQGRCEIDILWLDQRAIATIFWFRSGGTLHLQKIAYREDLAQIGPGKLIMAEALKRACADSTLNRVNFITRCTWADGWRPQILPGRTYTLYRENWRGKIAWLLQCLKRKIKALLKRRPLDAATSLGATTALDVMEPACGIVYGCCCGL